MTSLDWSHTYEILSISRLYLSSLGFTNEQIKDLTDEDIQRIAEWLENQYRDAGFDEALKFIVRLELAEKGGSSPARPGIPPALPSDDVPF